MASIANCFNNPKIEIEMCETLLELFDEVKKCTETRWGRFPLNSKRNLSWLASKKVNPVLAKIKTKRETAISTYSAIKINNNSKQNDIQSTALFLQKLVDLEASEKNAISLLSESLLELVTHYSPAKKKTKVKRDFPYCIYCFRECYQSDSDTCDEHAGVNRTKGKRFYKRYVDIKKAIHDYEVGKKVNFKAIALNALKENKIPSWAETNNKSAWLINVLTSLNICSKWKVNEKSVELLGQLSVAEFNNLIDWPSCLNGSMFRYQAYVLARTRKPTSNLIKKLNSVWGGRKITDVANQFKSERTGLQRDLKVWKNKIFKLRTQGVPDELIKVTFGLKQLPHS